MVQTTVLGSYPRIGDSYEEQGLRRAIARFDRGEVSEAEVHAAEREVVEAVLREQRAAGIAVITDGQVSWYDSQSHIARTLAGVEIGGLVRYFDTNTYYRQPIVIGAVRWTSPILVDEWTFAQEVSRTPVKAVLTGPVTMATLALDRHYGQRRALAHAFGKALAEEVGALRSAGARHIQVDEPILARRPEDLSLVTQTLRLLAARKESAELSLAIYFGDVAKVYRDLQKLPADALALDLVQGSKTWSQITKHGSNKPLVLGIVDARNTRIEEPRALAARVRGLRHAVDLEHASISPSNGLEFLPRATAREKLALLARTAEAVGGNA